MSNYVEMWKNLGMDLDTHDQLCQVLPSAFGDVYLSQENRPEGMGFWDFVVSEIHGIRPAELIEAQKNGQKVFGTFCVYVPDEVVIAANGIVTGLCGGSQFWVPGGEKVLPKSTCPLIKASVGARLDKTCPFFCIADMYVGETTCDGKKKAWEILGKEVPMYIMDIPQMKREKDIEKWACEIAEFAKVVEEFTGNKITVEKLNEAIKIINEKRKAMARVFAATKGDAIPISGKDRLLMTQIAFFDDPVRCAQMCNKLADELDERIKNNVSVFPAGTKRILLTGTPLAIPNWKLHHIIETSGAAVVCEEMCTGTRYFENPVDETQTTLEGQFRALSERYMKNNCACFTPNTGRIDDIIRLAKEYKVDGVIDVNLKFCCLYDTEGYAVEKALKEAGIPVLGIETDYTDTDAEQLRTRIGAFVEMLG
ncbi:MAG: 2-hydroxyacyl-CoA dehydratase [Lachnospiraceae bacterium]|nr:2-hydroxyacyl-CoA dehydratase [Lachnospiraceae bacterium]